MAALLMSGELFETDFDQQPQELLSVCERKLLP